MEKNDIKLSEEFVLSQKSLREAVAMSHDAEAAKLYRLMFNHEKNVSVLDSYAELLLNALIGSENKFVEEDYRNYLNYLKTEIPSDYETHRVIFDEYAALKSSV